MEEKKSIFKITGKWLLVLALILLFSLFFAFSFYVYHIIKSGAIYQDQPITTSKIDNPEVLKKIVNNKKNYWLGPANPKITIIEFGDFACSQCKNAFPTIREITQKYKNDIKFIFMDYPVISESSALLSLAARCAGEQGFFWPMHDKLYINQGLTEKEQLVELVREIGADTNRFALCLNAEKYLPEIQASLDDGQLLGVTGTPTWFINNNKVAGNIPHDSFINLIESLLKK